MTSPIHKNKLVHEGEKKIQKYIFSLKKLLGKGSFANVYLGRSIQDDLPVAVKVIDKKLFANKYNLKNIQSEIDIMKKVDHPNIVKLHNVYQTNNNMYIITQLCEDGDLSSYLLKYKKVHENEAVEFLRNIVSGFEYLLKMGIIHRDLKPANILLSHGKCKISDFGFARSLEYGSDTVLNSIVGTPLYMAPQILKHQSYSNKSDLWSVGLIFYELLHGYTPWIASNEMQLLSNICNKPLRIDFGVSEKSQHFMRMALIIKEQDRMSWEEAICHTILKDPSVSKGKFALKRLISDENYNINGETDYRSKSLKRRNTGYRSPLSQNNTANITRTPKRFYRQIRGTSPERRSPFRFE